MKKIFSANGKGVKVSKPTIEELSFNNEIETLTLEKQCEHEDNDVILTTYSALSHHHDAQYYSKKQLQEVIIYYDGIVQELTKRIIKLESHHGDGGGEIPTNLITNDGKLILSNNGQEIVIS